MSQQNRKLGLHLSIVSSLFGSLGSLSQEAEESGYDSLWVAEVTGPNAFVALAPCAMAPMCCWEARSRALRYRQNP